MDNAKPPTKPPTNVCERLKIYRFLPNPKPTPDPNPHLKVKLTPNPIPTTVLLII